MLLRIAQPESTEPLELPIDVISAESHGHLHPEEVPTTRSTAHVRGTQTVVYHHDGWRSIHRLIRPHGRLGSHRGRWRGSPHGTR